jgi:Protein of unknown function (DUF4199)
MTPVSPYSVGLRFGLITALVYIVLLFCRYNFFAGNPLSFGLFTIVSYLVILTLYFFAGKARKTQQGGFGSFKEIFQTILITIVIAELAFVIFTFFYLRYVDPHFFENFKSNTLTYLEKAGLKEDQIDDQMKKFKDMDDQMSPLNLLKGLGSWIVIDSIFGLIFAAILRKNKDFFDGDLLKEPQTP